MITEPQTVPFTCTDTVLRVHLGPGIIIVGKATRTNGEHVPTMPATDCLLSFHVTFPAAQREVLLQSISAFATMNQQHGVVSTVNGTSLVVTFPRPNTKPDADEDMLHLLFTKGAQLAGAIMMALRT